jgi:hypothetical protein
MNINEIINKKIAILTPSPEVLREASLWFSKNGIKKWAYNDTIGKEDNWEDYLEEFTNGFIGVCIYVNNGELYSDWIREDSSDNRVLGNAFGDYKFITFKELNNDR